MATRARGFTAEEVPWNLDEADEADFSVYDHDNGKFDLIAHTLGNVVSTIRIDRKLAVFLAKGGMAVQG